MNGYTRLVRPEQSQVQIDPTPKECPAEGFNYPTFKQLSKQGRVKLSQERFPLDPLKDYRLFAIANSKGWFAAAGLQKDGSSCVILSPLEELRSAFKTAKEGSEELFNAKRVLPVETNKPVALTFANNDTRLIIGFEQGQILAYDTATILSPGTNTLPPSNMVNNTSAPIIQLSANPGSEPSLSDNIAVVRGDGTVALMNTSLEQQGGWQASDDSTTPVSVAWSPKGKHIAIGLRSGDILTYPLTTKDTVHKHIPPTSQPPLASLEWLAPGHTFRTVYTPNSPGDGDASQHIIHVDSKSNKAVYYAPNYPYPTLDREKWQPIHLYLPKWDEDASSTESKALLLVGDKASVDLEILASNGTQWYQQSQENQLSLPLDSNQNDTTLVALETDLTNSSTSTPIMYAYLNDGTIQGWNLEHTKPYLGMVTPGAAPAAAPVSSIAPSGGSAFGQSSFSAKPPTTASSFGSASSFGQPATASTFGSATPSFGSSSFGQPATSSTFGSAAPTFGSSSFGQTPTTSAFGKPSAFGSTSTPSAFGSSGATNTTSAFGGGGSSNTGGGFGAFANKPSAGFGQTGFGFGGAPATTTTASLAPPTAPDMTREESMADGTSAPAAPAFGGLSLGGDSSTTSNQSDKPGIFGSISTSAPSAAPAESSSTFGGSPVKPATGFGAFNSFKPASAFGSSTTTTAPSAFSASTTNTTSTPSQSGFGQSSFGQSSFGKSSFGQPTTTPSSAFGQSSFGQPSAFGQSTFGKPAAATTTTTTPSSGGFGAFASAAPASFASAAAPQPASGSAFSSATASNTGGFGAFAPSASGSTSPFSAPSTSLFSKPATSGFGGSAPSPFSQGGVSPFAAPQNDAPAAFVLDPKQRASSSFPPPAETTTPKKPSGLTTPQDSPPTTPKADVSVADSDIEKSPAPAFSSTPAKSPSTGGAFGNLQTSPSVFKPASGFGAFGAASTTPQASPFFKAKAQESTTPKVTAFSSTPTVTPTASTSVTPAFGTSSTLGGSAFGQKSAFGALASTPAKSAFSPAATPEPIKAPAFGGFSAFSGSSSAFSSSTTGESKSSFKDLLKTEGASKKLEEKKPEATTAKVPPSKEAKEQAAKDEEQKEREAAIQREDTDTSMSKEDFGNLSLLSEASSFADVSHPSEEEISEGETDEHPSDGDYSPEEDSEEESEAEGSSVLSGSEADYTKDTEEYEDDESEVSENPVNVPLPPSRSGSQTPQKEVPALRFTPSPSPSDSEGLTLSTIPEEKEDTTTPPGTPIKQPTPVAAKALTSTPPPPFGLGVGGKSTRPARSSPLATGSVSSHDDEEHEKTPKRETSSPGELTLKDEPAQKPVRPKTPPLLATMKPAASVSAPDPSTSTPSGSSGFFGKPSTAQSAFSLPPPTPGSTFSLPKAPSPSAFGSPFSLQPQQKSEPPKSAFGSLSPPPPGQDSTPKPFSAFSLPKPAEKVETKPVQASPFHGLPFGGNKDAAKPSLPTAPTPPSPFSLGSFNLTPKPADRPASSPGSFFGAPPAVAPASAVKTEVKTPAIPSVTAPSQPTPEEALATLEAGMQKECGTLVVFIEKELNNLRQVAIKHTQLRTELSKSLGGSRHKAELGDAKKWGVADCEQFGHVLKQFEKDLDAVKEQRVTQKQSLKELQSSMLKAGTRKEEINRFNKAKTDKEFAKMLKNRTLGPEHLETQTQLRRNIRTIRDRIQKLEDHLQASKKKLAQVKSGKPMLRAPTLDTVNRTYRNIDIAVQQQADDVSRLAKRVAKLNVGGTPVKASGPRRDARLPDPVHLTNSPTPSYAVRSAAALNAERSAARLKRALLAVRKEPLLNTEAVGAAPTLESLSLTGAAEKLAITAAGADASAPSTPSAGLKLPSSMPRFSIPTTNSQPAIDPAFDFSPLPDDNFDPSHTPPPSRRGATVSAKKHSPAPVFKPSSQTSTPSSTPTFNWGPLPSFSNSPSAEKSKASPGLPFSFAKPS